MNIVTIKEVQNVVTCSDQGTAEHVFNVKNATGVPIHVSMQTAVSEPASSRWVQIEGAQGRRLEADMITQVIVKIDVSSEAAPGRYGYRLRVFDPKNPGENYTDGEMVYFDVPEPRQEPAPPPTPQKRNWIPFAAGAAVLVLVVAGVLLLTGGDKLPDFTQMELETAEAFLAEKEIPVEKEMTVDPQASRKILAQSPGPGTKLKSVDTVTLTIAGVKVPELTDLPLFNALDKIQRNNLSFDADTGLHSTRIPANSRQEGKVVTQKPLFNPNAVIPVGTPVELWVGVKNTLKLEAIISNQQMTQLKKFNAIAIPKNFSTRSIAPED